ncbi:acyltransferase domain-containing protein [Streptomyces sp. M19]
MAAAYVAGALTLDDAARVVALRSRILRELSGHGGMMSVALGADAVRERLARGTADWPWPPSTAPPPSSCPANPRPWTPSTPS